MLSVFKNSTQWVLKLKKKKKKKHPEHSNLSKGAVLQLGFLWLHSNSGG